MAGSTGAPGQWARLRAIVLAEPESLLPTPRAAFEDTARRERHKRERALIWADRRTRLRNLPTRLRQDDAAQRPEPTPEARADRTMLIVGMASSLAGLCLLMFLAYAFVFTGLQESRDQHRLLAEFANPTPNLLLGTDLSEGQPVGVLHIPAIGVDQVVVKGTSAADLATGPGLMPGTAQPGTGGNTVIAGRRTTAGAPFGALLSLQPGDRISMTTGLGSFTYRVITVGIADPGQPDPIAPTKAARLTLVTSNPTPIPSGRAYVVAKLVSPQASGPVPHTVPPPSARALNGDPGAVGPTIAWAVVLALVLTVSVASYRRWRAYIWTLYMLTTPVVLAVAVICFEKLYLLLPATL